MGVLHVYLCKIEPSVGDDAVGEDLLESSASDQGMHV